MSLQSLWVERTTLTLVQSLPGISRWFEVEKREVVSVTTKKLQQRERERETVIHYLQIQSRVWPTNTLVLISVITLNNINSPGHESEDIGLRLNFLHQRATVLL